ncbi:MAG: hypothetical protein FWD34_01130 [Oscillospiraceae bacterium]|nr:hypothetical protein [Oscillospiraceae bacterium]
MARASTIQHTLDLALRLIDTTVGRTISDDVRVKINGRVYLPKRFPDGDILFIGTGRTDFELTVSARGYEEKVINVKYDELEEDMPYIETHMIPSERYLPGIPCFTLKGELKGITELDAVKVIQHPCYIKEFDQRKRLITMFNPYNLPFNRMYYATAKVDDGVYEPFIIIKQTADNVYKIAKAFEKAFEQVPVAPRVMGKAQDGEYLLRVRDDSENAEWIIRYVTAKGEFFKTVDFNSDEQVVLK